MTRPSQSRLTPARTTLVLLALLSLMCAASCTGEIAGDPQPGGAPSDAGGDEDVTGGDVGDDVAADAPADAPPDALIDTNLVEDVDLDPTVDVVDLDAADGSPDAPVDAPADVDAAGDADPERDADAPGEPDAPQPPEGTLLDLRGCFFEVEAPDAIQRQDFGEAGTRYRSLTLDMDIVAGGWREDVFDRDVLNHNLFGLFRNGDRSYERYLLGVGAQVDPQAANLRRRLLFFARNAIEPGFMSYYAARRDFGWQPGETYHVHIELDAAAAEQRLVLSVGGEVVARVVEAIPYYGLPLTDAGWYLEFGSAETDHRDVSPVGWRFCDARVVGEVAE